MVDDVLADPQLLREVSTLVTKAPQAAVVLASRDAAVAANAALHVALPPREAHGAHAWRMLTVHAGLGVGGWTAAGVDGDGKEAVATDGDGDDATHAHRTTGLAEDEGKFSEHVTNVEDNVLVRGEENKGLNEGDVKCREVASELLSRCAGVPLTIAVAGRALAELMRQGKSWEEACMAFCQSLDDGERLGERSLAHKASFESTLRASLMLVGDFNMSAREDGENSQIGSQVLFFRLCVFQKQTPLSWLVLRRLWPELDAVDASNFCTRLMELNLLMGDDSHDDDCAARIHDLVLEFCEAEAKQSGVYEECHRLLLKSYCSFSSDSVQGSDTSCGAETESEFTCAAVEKVSRAWWSLDMTLENGFLCQNLARLLSCAKLLPELLATLTEPKWLVHRIRSGSVIDLLQDFDRLIRDLGQVPHSSTTGNLLRHMKDDVMSIRNAVSEMWLFVSGDPFQLLSQSHARLSGLGKSWVMQRYLYPTEGGLEWTWLCPLQRYWKAPNGLRCEAYTCRERVNDIGVDWDENQAVILDDEGVVVIDIAKREAVSTWIVPVYFHQPLALSADLSLVAYKCSELVWDSDGDDGGLIGIGVWDRNETIPLWETYILSTGNVMVKWSEDGTLLAVTSWGGTVKLFDGKTGTPLGTELTEPEALKLPLVTSMAITPRGEEVIMGGNDGSIVVWQTSNGLVTTTEAHVSAVDALHVIGETGRLVSGDRDGSLKWWGIKLEANHSSLVPLSQTDGVHTRGVRTITGSADGMHVVTGGADGVTRWWDGKLLQQLGEWRQPGGTTVTVARTSPDGAKTLTVGLDRIVRWFAGVESDNGQRNLPHGSRVMGVSIVNDGRSIVSFGIDNKLTAIQTCTGEEIWCRPGLGIVKSIGTGGSSVVIIHNASDATRINIEDGSLQDVFFVSLRPETLVVSWEASGVVTLEKGILSFRHGRTGELFQQIQAPDLERQVVMGASKDCLRVASSGVYNGLVWWDLENDEVQRKRTGRGLIPVRTLAISAGGRWVVTASDDGSIAVWKWRSLYPCWEWCKAHSGMVSGVAMNTNGTRFVTVGSDRQLKLWSRIGSNDSFALTATVSMPAALTCVDYGAYGDENGNGGDVIVVGDIEGGVWTHDIVDSSTPPERRDGRWICHFE